MAGDFSSSASDESDATGQVSVRDNGGGDDEFSSLESDSFESIDDPAGPTDERDATGQTSLRTSDGLTFVVHRNHTN